jgi:hypothetical protein
MIVRAICSTTKVVATPGHMVAAAAGELVILHGSTGTYFGLNSVGRRIWELLAIPTCAEQIASRIAAEFEVDSAVACTDTLGLLVDLLEQNLVGVLSED